eukprot:1137748-Pelagomonas_calceolata.AAC.5
MLYIVKRPATSCALQQYQACSVTCSAVSRLLGFRDMRPANRSRASAEAAGQPWKLAERGGTSCTSRTICCRSASQVVHVHEVNMCVCVRACVCMCARIYELMTPKPSDTRQETMLQPSDPLSRNNAAVNWERCALTSGYALLPTSA